MKLIGRVINQFERIVTVELLKPVTLSPGSAVSIQYNPDDCNQQLRGLLWLLIEFLGKYYGYTPPEMYAVLKTELHYFDTITGFRGEQIRIDRSTANGEIDNQHLSEFYQMVEQFALDSMIGIEPFIKQHEAIRKQRGKE